MAHDSGSSLQHCTLLDCCAWLLRCCNCCSLSPTACRDAEVVISTLRGDGCVLIPVDAAGRMLEVAMLLDEFWSQEKCEAFTLGVASAPNAVMVVISVIQPANDHLSAVWKSCAKCCFEA